MAIGEPDAVFTVEPIDPATTAPDNAPEPKPERQAEGQAQGQGSLPAEAAEGHAVVAGDRMQRRASAPKPKQQSQQTSPFLSRSVVRNRPVSGYIVQGLIPKRGVGQIYGDSGCGKSFTTMMLVHCLATGMPFCGHKTRQCAVYYFHLEGLGGVPKRLAAFDKWMEEAGWTQHNEAIDSNLHFWLEPFSLKKDINKAVQFIKQDINKNIFIVIDTQAQSMIGIDESSSKEMGEMLGKARGLARAVDGNVCLIHHTGKDPSRGGRGSSAQRAEFDYQFEAEKSGETIIWTSSKERDEKDRQSLRFKLKIYPDVVKDEDGELQSSCVAIPETELEDEERKTLYSAKTKSKSGRKSDGFKIAKDIFYQTIHEYGKEGRLAESKFREAFFAKFPVDSEEADKAKEAKRKAYKRQLQALVAERVVEQDGEWLRYRQEDATS